MARRPMEAAGAVDAENAPTAPWKPADGFPTATTGTLIGNRGNESVTHVPGLLCYRCSRLLIRNLSTLFVASGLK